MNKSAAHPRYLPQRLRSRSARQLIADPQIAENEDVNDSSHRSQTNQTQPSWAPMQAKTQALRRRARVTDGSAGHLDREGKGETLVPTPVPALSHLDSLNPPTLTINQRVKSRPFW